MIQIYFLSIFFNVLAGYVLVFSDDNSEMQSGFSLSDETVRMVLGVFSMLTGILKILTPIGGFFILGDIIPAAAGFAAGLILLIDYYKNKSTIAQESEGKPGFLTLLTDNKKIVGYIAFAAAALHFFFPRIIFL